MPVQGVLLERTRRQAIRLKTDLYEMCACMKFNVPRHLPPSNLCRSASEQSEAAPPAAWLPRLSWHQSVSPCAGILDISRKVSQISRWVGIQCL